MPPPRTPRCFVVAIGRRGRRAESRRLVEELRDAGVPTAATYEERPLKAQLKMADRAGAEFVAIVGEHELADGVVTLRRLRGRRAEVGPARRCGRVAHAARRLERVTVR